MRQENEQVIVKFDEQVEENRRLIRNIQSGESEVNKAHDQIKVLEAEIQDRERKLILTQLKLDNLKEHAGNFKELLDKVLMQLSTTSRMVKKMRDDKFQLEKTIENLKFRSAAGFENLTPRPDFKRLLESNQIELKIKPVLEAPQKKKHVSSTQLLTTAQRFELLVEKYLELNEHAKKVEHDLEATKNLANEHLKQHLELKMTPRGSPLNSPRNRGSVRERRPSAMGRAISSSVGRESLFKGTDSRRSSKENSAIHQNDKSMERQNSKIEEKKTEGNENAELIEKLNVLTESQNQIERTQTATSNVADGEKTAKNEKGEKVDVLGRPLKVDAMAEELLKMDEELVQQITDTKMMIDQILHD